MENLSKDFKGITAAAEQRIKGLVETCFAKQSAGLIEGDVNVLFRRCAFIKHCVGNAHNLGGTKFIYVLSNLSHIKESDYLIHQKLGRPSKHYRWEEMQQIIVDLRYGAPVSCEAIRDDLGFIDCPEYPACRVKSPIGWLSPRGHYYDLVLTLLEKEQIVANELLQEPVLQAWAEIFKYDESDFDLLALKVLDKDPEFRIDVFTKIIKLLA
ncbi:MAG: hypothetical protein P4N59_11795 [Negativicutes bacterium]|nr:hypothetical protein [Negativicutes bacterium]